MPGPELHAMRTLASSPATAESAGAEAHTSSDKIKEKTLCIMVMV